MKEHTMLPKSIFSGNFPTGHCQGIAIDTKREYIYYSFTTVLVKTDLQGNLIGTVDGIVGHLGCLCFNDEDGCVYGSLEYKQDAIGRGILAKLGDDRKLENAFYLARFDVSKIDRFGMDAERDGIMTAIYCKEVVCDYLGTGENGKEHHLGCSGIDGTTIAPAWGERDGEKYLYVAYGVYGDVNRSDNDYQVILVYSLKDFAAYAKPLSQSAPHHSGMAHLRKLYAYTGNTTYGIQNLEYDPVSGDFYAAVYPGSKAQFENPPFFILDGSKAPVRKELKGNPGKTGEVVEVKSTLNFPHGDTGMISLGEGLWYFSHHGRTEDGKQNTTVRLYRRNVSVAEGFEEIE